MNQQHFNSLQFVIHSTEEVKKGKLTRPLVWHSQPSQNTKKITKPNVMRTNKSKPRIESSHHPHHMTMSRTNPTVVDITNTTVSSCTNVGIQRPYQIQAPRILAAQPPLLPSFRELCLPLVSSYPQTNVSPRSNVREQPSSTSFNTLY